MAAGLTWEFVVPSSATTCAEQAKEMIQFCDQLYKALGDFLVPIEISYCIHKLGKDTEIRPDGDTGEGVIQELRNEDGIRVSEFIESTDVAGPNVRWIPRVPFGRNRYKIHFDGTDYTIERSDCTPYRNGKCRQDMAIPDPLELTVTHRPAQNIQSVTTNHVLTVSVAMHSDLWLRNSESGRKNRAYLLDFFADIADAISATSVQRDKYRTSDFWNDLSVYSSDDDYIELEPEAIY
ncbi:hypothetical protein C443_00077 [Haloarcula argentinensis DSM 12282]|nr:hypothetical protein C443_00077 [Haloarcula argentinensis DSM 12282]